MRTKLHITDCLECKAFWNSLICCPALNALSDSTHFLTQGIMTRRDSEWPQDAFSLDIITIFTSAIFLLWWHRTAVRWQLYNSMRVSNKNNNLKSYSGQYSEIWKSNGLNFLKANMFSHISRKNSVFNRDLRSCEKSPAFSLFPLQMVYHSLVCLCKHAHQCWSTIRQMFLHVSILAERRKCSM